MRIPVLAVSLLALSVSAVQASPPQLPAPPSPTWSEHPSEADNACPVAFDVRHGLGGTTLQAGGTPRKSTPQVLDLTLHNISGRYVTSIDAIVQTASGKLHLQPLAMPSSANDRTATEFNQLGEQIDMHLHPSLAARHSLQLDWNLPSHNQVLYVEVRRVTYQDGSTWSPSASSACRYTPDPFMLINVASPQ